MSSQQRLVLRNIELATPNCVVRVDLVAEGGRWTYVGPAGTGPAEPPSFAVDGLVAFPGLVDVHVHFREPGDHAHKATYASESRAAAAGGVTTVLTMPNTKPFTNTVERLDEVRAVARTSSIDYGFHFMADGANWADLLRATNVAAFKMFLNETTGIQTPLDDTATLDRLLALGHPLMAHAEGAALDRLLARHRAVGAGWLHIGHVALAREVEALRRAQGAGQWVTGEASPHHLLLDESDAQRLGPLADMRPTLKSPADVAALWAGLADGTLAMIATDHAPHLLAEKQQVPAPPGVPGVQTMLPLLLDAAAQGRLTWPQIARLTSAAPAQLFGLCGKGAVRIGGDADLVLVDPQARSTITDAEQLTLPGWTPFAGRRVQGRVVRTILHGATIFADGQATVDAGGREVQIAR